MDKTTMKHDKFPILEFDKVPISPARMKEYGLWFCGSRCASPEHMKNTTPNSNSYSQVRHRIFHYYVIAHLVAGKGRVWLENGVEKKMLPGDCVIVTEGMLNRYGGTDGETFVEDTLNFAGPIAEMMQQSGVLRSGVFFIGQVRKLKIIHELLMEGTIDSHLDAAFRLQQLLMKIYLASEREKWQEKHPIDSCLQEIADAPEKWWNVQELAEICGLSETHLRRLFLERTGYSPKEYIDRQKMRMAEEMLLMTEKNIGEIAQSLGYVDPFHFSRRFKAVMGISPKFYRKQPH